MTEQMILGQFAAPTKAGKKPKQEKRCENCRYCAVLMKPYERADGSIIYGYCFGDGDKDYSPNMGKGRPIWLPLDCGGGMCDKYKRMRKETLEERG